MHFSAQARKIKKYRKKPSLKKFPTFSQKKFFLYFGKTELSIPKINNFLIFSEKKVFLIFQEMKLSSPKIKKFQKGTFRAQKLKKLTLKKFLVYLETEFSSSKFKKLLYIFLNKFLIFQEGTLNYRA